MFPQWARAYSFTMTQVRGGRTPNPFIAATQSQVQLEIKIINEKVIEVNGRPGEEGWTMAKLKSFLKSNAGKFNSIKIDKDGQMFTKTGKKYNISPKKKWIEAIFGLTIRRPTPAVRRESTVEQPPIITSQEGQLVCLQVEDLVNPQYKHNNSNKIQIIESDGNSYYIRLSDKKDSALIVTLHHNDEITLERTIPKEKKLLIDGNIIKLTSDGECTSLSKKETNLSYVQMGWKCKFRKGFKPSSWQFLPIKYGGNKLLLCHRPGFGKTINSILLAERMRNSMPDPKPKILLIIPGRKLLKQWIEVLKCMNRNLSDYIWMTYDIFLASQSATNEKRSYPSYDQIHPDYLRKLEESVAWKGGNGLDKPEPLKEYKKEQNNVIYCKYCAKAYYFGTKPGYCNAKPLRDILPDKVDIIKKIKYGKLKHRVWLGRNNHTDVRFTWNLNEDQILFHCNCIGGQAKFITGFTPTDIEYSGLIKTWDDYKAQFDDPKQVKDLRYYLYREDKQYKKFMEYKNSIAKVPVPKPKVMKLNYIEQQNFVYHQYRPPNGCIMVCDEIHKIVRSKIGIKMQTIWKYSLQTPFSIFLTATPLEGSNQFKQIHLLSEMLKMKREISMDLYLGDTKYTGFPPWHELQPMRKYKDVYELTARLKNKFSRHNTVDDIDMSVKNLYGEVRKGEEKKYELNHTNLMALYTGKTLDKWVDNGSTEDGQELYKFVKGNSKIPGDKKLFVDEALKTIYQSKKNNFGESEFPELKRKPDEQVYLEGKIKDGIYEISLDYHRANMVWKRPNMELRLSLKGNMNSVSVVNGSIRIGENGNFTLEQIRSLQTAILCNKTPERGVYTISKYDEDPDAPIVSAYTGLAGIPCSGRNTVSVPDGVTALGAEDDLKWLNVNPVIKQKNNRDLYEGVPYIPDLLGSKILHIVMTIEDAVRDGKNVMVFHPNVEILRALQRGMAMRKHKFRNQSIIDVNVKSGIDAALADDGDYDFASSDLLLNSKASAKRRFSKMPMEYRQMQNDMFKYGFTPQELKMENEYNKDELKIIFDDIIKSDALFMVNYKYFYLRYENHWEYNKKKDNILDIATSLLKFAEYAEEKYVRQEITDYLRLIDSIETINNIAVGKLTYEKRVKFIEAMELYRDIRPEKQYEMLVVGVCKPFYEKAKDLNGRIKHKKFKESVAGINLGKADINIITTPDKMRAYYFSKFPGKGTRFRSTYKKPKDREQYESLIPGRTKNETKKRWESLTVIREELSMPPIDFQKWNEYKNKYKTVFNLVQNTVMPKKFVVKELDITGFKTPFPDSIQNNGDFYTMYMYVDQFFQQKLKEFIDKDSKISVDKNIDQLSQAMINYINNPKYKDLKGRGYLNIGNKTWKDGKKIVLERLRKRWSGMDNFTVHFGILEGDSVKQQEYPKFVQAFSEGFIDCLMVSPTAIEGIDFRSCSSSLMICIDPVSIAGKKDQFNGRTVRKNSHDTLPRNMRVVEELTFCTKEYSEDKAYEPPARDIYFDKTDAQLRALKQSAKGAKLELITQELERRSTGRTLENNINTLTDQVVEIENEITGSKHTRVQLKGLVERRNKLGTRLKELGDEDWEDFENETVDNWKDFLIGETQTRIIARSENISVREDEVSKWNTYFDTYVNISHVLCVKNLVFISPDEYKRHKKYMTDRGDNFKHFCHVCESFVDLNMGSGTWTCPNCNATVIEGGKPVYYHLMPIKGFIQPKDKINLKNGRGVEVSDRNRVQRDIVEMALSLQSLEHATRTRGDNITKLEIDNNERKKWYYRRVVTPSISEYIDTRDWNEQVWNPDSAKFQSLCELYKNEEEDRIVPENSLSPSLNFDVNDRVLTKMSDGNWIEGTISEIKYYNDGDGLPGYYYKINCVDGKTRYSEVWNNGDMQEFDSGNIIIANVEEYDSDVSIQDEY